MPAGRCGQRSAGRRLCRGRAPPRARQPPWSPPGRPTTSTAWDWSRWATSAVDPALRCPCRPGPMPCWSSPAARVLAVARRPGDWLLRWRPGRRPAAMALDRRRPPLQRPRHRQRRRRAALDHRNRSGNRSRAASVCAMRAAWKRPTNGPPTAWIPTSCWCCRSASAPFPPGR